MIDLYIFLFFVALDLSFSFMQVVLSVNAIKKVVQHFYPYHY